MKFRHFLVLSALSCSQVSGTPTTYVEKPVFGSGSANVAPANGGEYVYGAVRPDGRVAARPVLTGAVERQVYVYFTPDEERILSSFRDSQLAKIVKERLAADRARYAKRRSSRNLSLEWPKVVLRGSEICVPELANSDSPDWKEHLTCYQGKEQR